jgi:predicted nuclease of predicted toxin-antitoxin system
MRLKLSPVKKSESSPKLAKFVIDEDIARSTGNLLADAGHEIIDIRDQGLRGAEDERIFRFAQSKKAILLTGDIGFGNLIKFPPGSHHGILIVHFPNELPVLEINRQILLALSQLKNIDLSRNLTIIEPGKIRIRRHK